jgi:Tol biopolymer transport system component
MAYVPGPAGVGASKFDIVLSDRKGQTEPLRLPAASYEYPRASPDGKQIAFDTDNGQDAVVWVYDLAGTSAMRRLTFGGRNRFPIWSGDGQRIAYQSTRDGDTSIYWQRADGTGAAERLTRAESGTSHTPDAWSRAGDLMAFTVAKASSFSIWIYSAKDRKSVEFEGTKSNALPTAVFSPDGRWIAYSLSDNTSNTTQVYVQPVPPTGVRYQLFAKAPDNPHHPLWSADGKELFYIPRVGALEVVSVVTRPAFAFGNPVAVPRSFPTAAPTTPRTFDVVPTSGKIVSVATSGPASSPASAAVINVVLNWFEELNARVPTRR